MKHTKTAAAKTLLLSLNKKVNPYKAFIYRLCRDFLCANGYVLGTKILILRNHWLLLYKTYSLWDTINHINKCVLSKHFN